MLEVTRRILDRPRLRRADRAQRRASAIRLAQEHDGAIDLLLTDVVMPDMLGKEVAERVAALRPGIRVLFMSGYAQAVVEPVGDLTGGRGDHRQAVFRGRAAHAGARDAGRALGIQSPCASSRSSTSALISSSESSAPVCGSSIAAW